jgi:hypothetical protein
LLRDEEGRELPDKVVTVCGVGCFVGVSDGQGAFSVRVEMSLQPEAFALSAHGRPTHASTYVRLPPLASQIEFPSPVVLPRLPEDGPVLPEDEGEGGAVSSGPLTLVVAAGTTFELDIDDIERGEEGRKLRAVSVDPASATFVEGALQLVTMAPFGAKLSRPAGVVLEAPPGLEEGAEVSLVILEDDLLADAGNLAGTGRAVATGRVEGGKIVSDPGQGVEKLTWIAVLPR